MPFSPANASTLRTYGDNDDPYKIMARILRSCGKRRRLSRAHRLLRPVGEDDMRSNSGKDEARNNLHDPTLGDRELGRGDTATEERKPKAPADHRKGRK